MSIYDKWLEKTDETKYTTEQINAYIREYYLKEKDAYAQILAAKETKVVGTVAGLAEKYGMEPFEMTAFIDGINTSIEKQYAPEELEESSEVELDIVWEKLYYNMHVAKASWLYELTEWDEILTAEKREEIKRQYHADCQAVSVKVGRNDPCPCGSGKKYKKCCGK